MGAARHAPGWIAPRAAVTVSRLRGNQPAASGVVVRRSLTVRQTDRRVYDRHAAEVIALSRLGGLHHR